MNDGIIRMNLHLILKPDANTEALCQRYVCFHSCCVVRQGKCNRATVFIINYIGWWVKWKLLRDIFVITL